jgi:hypothetical protein
MFVTSIVLAVLVQAAPDARAKTELAGVVVDTQGKPVAGVEVLLSSLHRIGGRNPTLARTTTDAQGRFRHEAPAEGREGAIEIWTLWAHRPGASIAAQAVGSAEGLPRPGSPIKLTLGPAWSVTIEVLDPTGRPVEGARVRPVYHSLSAATSPLTAIVYSLPIPREIVDRLAASTDARGVGELAGLSAVEVGLVQVEAPLFGDQLLAPTAAKGGTRTARLAPAGRLTGHVTGPNPGRARGVRIEVSTSMNGAGAQAFQPEGKAEVTIDDAGRLEIPALAAGKLRLALQPSDGSPERELPTPGIAIEAGKTCEVTIPLAGVDRLRIIAGQVVNRQGKPVAGAVVFQSGDGPKRTRTTTDDQGRFRLEGVDDGPAFVFARRAGFRFHGQLVAERAGSVTMALMRTDEKPTEIRTRPSPLPHREELALARRVIDAYADRILKEGDLNDKVRTLEALARVEPDRVLAEAEKGKYPDPFYNDMFRLRVVEGMAPDDPDAAAEIAESGQTPMFRALAYVTVAGAFEPSPRNRARRIELLDQSLLHARGVKEGDKRLACLGQVADQLLDLGETDRATKVLREGEKIARELPNAAWAGYARGAFADELAQIDLDAALALTKDLSDPHEFDRHHGNIAQELAGTGPAAAERVLAMVRNQRDRDSAAIRVCYRMAPVDLARARRITGGIKHTLMKPYALGMMAQALAGPEKTRPVAAELLAAAFDEMAGSVEAGKDEFNNMESAAVMAASLLPVAEAIDPALVPEYLWRSVSFRRPTPGPEGNPAQAWFLDGAAAGLAMRIARYDPATARGLLDPIVRGVVSEPEKTGAAVGREAIVALAVVDPQKAIGLLEQLPDGPPRSLLHQTKDRARWDLVAVLARPADRRWKYLQWHFFHAWVPDVEDIVAPF